MTQIIWYKGFSRLDDDVDFPIHIEKVRRLLPGWQQRRALLARDPLASVDGFHVLIRLLLQHLFGVNICHRCPDCDETKKPCTDCRGSNASLSGGVFGRAEAVYVTIEAQKSSGSLHGHIQCFIQCLHQHTPLTEIFQLPFQRLEALRAEYCRYTAHVAHSVYAGQSPTDVNKHIAEAESTWPTHEYDVAMMETPRYQYRRAPNPSDEAEASAWTKQYLEEDVVRLQYLKQHHYHPRNDATGQREPLRGCQKQDRPGVCKSDFPRDAWLCDESKVLCPCQLTRHGLTNQRRKNRLGALHGPYGHPYLNPCHPAVLAGMRGGNNDVQLAYRLPYRCEVCGLQPTAQELQNIALAAQRAQDAQTGYCSDYCAKNQPMGFHEIKEYQKGHIALSATLKNDSINQIGRRHANRILSDAYCKGIVRGQVECCNLRANHVENQIVAAERISTANFSLFPGHAYLRVADAVFQTESGRPQKTSYVKTPRAPRTGARHLREAVTAEAYGHRPCNSLCWPLSPFEFTRYWQVTPTRVPYTRAEWENSTAEAWDVSVTEEGRSFLQTLPPNTPARLKPGKHYQVSLKPSADCLLFATGPATTALRHDWYLARRPRPRCPHFAQAPVPHYLAEDVEKNARLISVYFRAWTLNYRHATPHVPYLGDLKATDATWEHALRTWLRRLPCMETKRYVGNFLSVYRVRPTGEEDGNSDDDAIDEPLKLNTEKDLDMALRTLLPAYQQKVTKTENDATAGRIAESLSRVDALWKTPRPPANTGPASPAAYCDLDSAAALKATRKRGQPNVYDPNRVEASNPSIQCTRNESTPEAVERWLNSLQATSTCNEEQRHFCSRVATRVKAELSQESSDLHGVGNPVQDNLPLRWVLHGGPGTGKSHVLKFLRQSLFEQTLGWQHGVQFQIVSFQAVMAELLDGDTIHHALGLAWHKSKGDNLARLLELAQKTTQLRWLIIDEFSMVSAELLAQLEMRCRELMRDLSMAKYKNGEIQPFGGLNVILAGDVYQLPPPKGTFLAEVPWDLLAGMKASKQATAFHGQTLMWGGSDAGIQGMTELTTCERTRDAWLTQVQNEFRRGELTDDSHAFLHGRPTSVPGSWTTGELLCRQLGCLALLQPPVDKETILRNECEQCARERRTRQLVATSTDDPRFRDEFASAVTVFGTNNLKYHTNKLRALQWAAEHNETVAYAIAQDQPSAAVFQANPNLAQQKMEWLQRHDKESGGLYGVLPLCVGMPVRATDHLDRERGILKGCTGVVYGWSACSNSSGVWQKPPEVIYVRFATAATWQVSGMPENNVYPVALCKRTWWLDSKRKYPQLRVIRKQFPLAPQFAITAHVAQGQTIHPGVVADSCIGDNGNPFTAYVAFTRVTGREKLLIFRPFDAAPFQKGVGLGRELLLRHLRGTKIDWAALLAKYREERVCSGCSEKKPQQAYTGGQWKRLDRDRVCRECCQRHADAGRPWQCNRCKGWHAEINFPEKHRKRQCSFYRVCLSCEWTKPCYKCGRALPEAEFGSAAWKARNANRRVCRSCAAKVRGHWSCSVCQEQRPVKEFSAWKERHAYQQDGTQRCNDCLQEALVGAIAQRVKAKLARLRKRIKTEHQAAIVAKKKQRNAAILAEVRALIAAQSLQTCNQNAPPRHTTMQPHPPILQRRRRPVLPPSPQRQPMRIRAPSAWGRPTAALTLEE